MLTFLTNRTVHAEFPERSIFSNLDLMRDGKAETATAVAYGLNTATKLNEKHEMVIQSDKRTGDTDH